MGSHWRPPDEFDDYRLIRELGRGSMGAVWLARDLVLDRPVAIKFIDTHGPDPNAVRRMRTEARAAARIQHPNVTAIYRFGDHRGRPYIVSEYIRGNALDQLDMPLPWRGVLPLAIDLASGLAAAHRMNVLHRDIKLTNALVDEAGRVRLLDFGLAKLLESPDHSLRRVRKRSLEVDKTLDAHGRREPQKPASFDRISHGAPEGGLIGTPIYLAPELWAGVAASRQSDVYALGVVLYELATGRAPHESESIFELASTVPVKRAPPVRTHAPQLDARFAAIIDRCLELEPSVRYSTADELRVALQILQRSLTSPRETATASNPYRGLLAFQEEHRGQFFGRASEIQSVLDRLRAEPFVLVVGDSGVGKSSLCRAGVLPQVRREDFDPDRRWRSFVFTPGRKPLRALLLTVASVFELSDLPSSEELADAPELLARALLRAGDPPFGVVMMIDQFEELTTIADPQELEILGRVLAQIMSGVPGLKILATARADFLTRLAQLPRIGLGLTRALYLLRPLTEEGMREAVVGPARTQGVRFESESLIDDLVQAGAGGSLPLLQFALAELWEVRDSDSDTITAADLERIGGVSGALARHADSVLLALVQAKRSAAKTLLLRLVTPEGPRERLDEAELTADVEAGQPALEALVRGRLVIAREVDEGTIYEIAHEALITRWETLRRWLDGEKGAREARRRLEFAAREWHRLSRRSDALYRAPQLAELDAVDEATLPEREREFLRQSRSQIRRSRLLIAAAVFGLVVTLITVYAATQLRARQQLDARVDEHLASARDSLDRARAQAKTLALAREESFALFDDGDGVAGEQRWLEVIAETELLEDLYGQALKSTEAALSIDPADAETRELLGDILYERAELAERANDRSRVQDLRARMEFFDPAGDRGRRWEAPASLAVTTDPAGAAITIERYTRAADGRRELEDYSRPGRSPVENVELDAGSYLITARASGHAEVRYPVLVRRGEPLRLALELPLADVIPDGFVYVPAGRFVFGSADDEDLRRTFFGAAPAHEVNTGAYLIARHETTVGQWIEFLESLSSEERDRRLGETFGSLAQGARLVQQGRGRWGFEYEYEGKTVRAAEGEPFRYPGRSGDPGADWRLFPVSGISWDDANAYLAWLASSGAVPGARFCTEVEWERAARGADGRHYPHGDTLRPGDANFDETHDKDPLAMGLAEIGSYPRSVSPFGVHDMAGNVFEWVNSSLAVDETLIRGGGYYYDRVTLRAVNRNPLDPGFRDAALGVRVCSFLRR